MEEPSDPQDSDLLECLVLAYQCLTFLGILHADTAVAIKARWTAAADIAYVRRPAVDALNTRKTGPAGACCRHIGSQRPNGS